MNNLKNHFNFKLKTVKENLRYKLLLIIAIISEECF